MQEWLSHPAFQSGLAPFVVALVAAELLLRLRLSGLAVIAGFCATVYLVADFTFFPLTAVRKIILTGLPAGCIGLLLDLLFSGRSFVRYLVAIAGGAVAIWVFWTALGQRSMQEALLYGAGAAVYVMWIAAAMDGLGNRPVQAGAAGWALGE